MRYSPITRLVRVQCLVESPKTENRPLSLIDAFFGSESWEVRGQQNRPLVPVPESYPLSVVSLEVLCPKLHMDIRINLN